MYKHKLYVKTYAIYTKIYVTHDFRTEVEKLVQIFIILFTFTSTRDRYGLFFASWENRTFPRLSPDFVHSL